MSGTEKRMTRLEQIRRSHKNARPDVVENPAWFHTHTDLSYVLAALDETQRLLREHYNKLDVCKYPELAREGTGYWVKYPENHEVARV